MRPLESSVALTLLVAACLGLAADAAAVDHWRARTGVVTFSTSPRHLESLGLELAGVRRAQSHPPDAEQVLEGSLQSFEVTPGTIGILADGARFAGLDVADADLESPGTAPELPVRGGFVLTASHAGTGERRAPTFVYDATLAFTRSGGRTVIEIRTADPGLPVPLEVHDAGARFEPHTGRLTFYMGDLRITDALARRLGSPELAGAWVGTMELRLDATLERSDGVSPAETEPLRGGVIDVLLGELYGLSSFGRLGAFPNGTNGLSAATTSCNNGDVPVPWNEPMGETHPFIGLGLFRLRDGILEQVGKNWLKHGWFALSNNQCFLGCDTQTCQGGVRLCPGCSDTYSASNNASRFFLGPREEVDPHTGDWTALGSFFDGIPVDGVRSYFGAASDDVAHRLEVRDADLGNVNADSSAARYFYEGVYYVADDDTVSNNIGYREVEMSWTGSAWSFSTQGAGLSPTPGPVALSWGDQQDAVTVAPDDGLVMLSSQVTDLGGGQWHYEYALYNRTSDRGVRSFSLPVGAATVTNVAFRDMDQDAGNDWTASLAGGAVTWSTDDFATDPLANALHFQSMYNFRFDADFPPVSAPAKGELFEPGAGSSFFLSTQAPAAATSSPAIASAAGGFALASGVPNPFRGSTEISFSLPRPDRARLSVLDVAGRTVQVLLDGPAPAGTSAVRWDGRDATGSRAAAGVYFVRLETAEGVRTAKTVRLR